MLHLVREDYPNVPAVFVDTGLEYPEIREFVKTFDNVTWLKPKMNFRKVIELYGYPFIGKEASERIYSAQRYIDWYFNEKIGKAPSLYGMMDLCGVKRNGKEWKLGKNGEIPSDVLYELSKKDEKMPVKVKQIVNPPTMADGTPTQYDFRKWLYLAYAPFKIGNRCCDIMKKAPSKKYTKLTGRVAITAQMASESRLRTSQWIKHGCNAFDAKKKISNPMSFWTEQDVLLYIKQNNIPICSVYGDIVEDEEIDGQMNITDFGMKPVQKINLKTTGCSRTGCMFCGYGCHLEKEGEGRFERMKETHPKQYAYIMKPWDKGGLGYKEVIDWMNEHGNLNIRY